MNHIIQAIAERQRRREAAQKSAGRHFRQCSQTGYAYKCPGADELALADPGSQVIGCNDKLMSARFVVSTIKQDRDGDVVVPTGISLANYAKNAPWFFGHQVGDWAVPIGTSINPLTKQLAIQTLPDHIVAECFFDQGDPDAVYIYGKVARGFLRATSIGFVPLEAERLQEKAHSDARPRQRVEEMLPGWFFKRIDLIEISIVGVPSNPEAVLTDLKSAKISDRLRKSLQHFEPVCKISATSGWDGGGGSMSKKWRKAAPKKKDSMSEGSAPAGGALLKPEYKDRGADIQSIHCLKTNFKTLPDAVKWVSANGYKAEGKEVADAFLFQQFEAKDCTPDSLRREKLADGVEGMICQARVVESPEDKATKQVKAFQTAKACCKRCGGKWTKDIQDCVSRKIAILINEGKPEDQAAAIAYSMCGEEEKAMADEQDDDPLALDTTPEPEPSPEEPPAEDSGQPSDMAHGPWVAQSIVDHLQEAINWLESEEKKIELPKLQADVEKFKPILQEWIATFGEYAGAAESEAKEEKPEDDKLEGQPETVESVDKDEPGDEDEDEDETKALSGARRKELSSAYIKRLGKRYRGKIGRAAEYMKEAADDDEFPKKYKAGHHYHSAELSSLIEEKMEEVEEKLDEMDDKLEEVDDHEGSEEEQKGLDGQAVAKALADLRKEFNHAVGAVN